MSDKKCVGTTASGEKRADGAPRHALETLRWVRSVCRKDLSRVWVLCATRCASAVIAVSFALLMSGAIDAATSQDAAAFGSALALFSAAIFLQVALSCISKWLSGSAQVRVDNALRAHVAQLLMQGGRLPEGRLTGEVMSVLTSDVSVVANGMVTMAPEVLSMAVRAVAAFVLMFAVAPPLGLLFVVGGLVCVGISLAMKRWLKRLHREAQEAEATMRGHLQEDLEDLVVIRSFGAAGRVMASLRGLMDRYLAAYERRIGASVASGAVFSVAMQLSYLAGFCYGCWGILTGRMSYGTLMALVQLVGQVRAPFSSLSGVVPQLAVISASRERIQALVPERREVLAAPVGAAFEALRFDDVDFGYAEGEPGLVLKDFSAEVRAGEFVAVTGPSGIGKSTMLALALGMVEPAAGHVTVAFAGGVAIDAASLAPGAFAYVPQGNMLMSGSVREVVAMSERGSVDDGRVWRACEAACADDFLRELPEGGLDAQLGEGGSGLSVGQMQRLAVARAVYSDAPVLLLDECTSALDQDIEHRMLSRLRDLGKTVIIVTHRPAALEVCDRVIQLGE